MNQNNYNYNRVQNFGEQHPLFFSKEMKKWRRDKKRLEYLRQELRAERISYGELAELQSMADVIDPDDVELLEPAGVSEDEATKRAKKWRLFQEFMQSLEKKDIEKVRRHLIAIEKAILSSIPV